MSLELLKAGFLAAVIQVERRLDYYEALNLACSGEQYHFIKLLAHSIAENFKTCFWALVMVIPHF